MSRNLLGEPDKLSDKLSIYPDISLNNKNSIYMFVLHISKRGVILFA